MGSKRRPDKVSARLEQIAAARADPSDRGGRQVLEAALADASNHVVAAAADAVRDLELRELGPALVAAFARFEVEPEARDKTCAAKIALARALDALDLNIEGQEVFQRGLRIFQLEPAWGAPIDTAAPLRALCAGGLARTREPDVVLALVDLLVDAEKVARVGGAHALGCCGRHEAIPVLRLKALTGDPEPEVTGECFTSLLLLDPGAGVDFVAHFLADATQGVREAAALALGQSRQPRALGILQGAWSRPHERTFGRVLLLAIALLRTPEATDFLVALIARGERPGAVEALAALAVFRGLPGLRDRVKAAVEDAIAAGATSTLRGTFDAEFEGRAAERGRPRLPVEAAAVADPAGGEAPGRARRAGSSRPRARRGLEADEE